MSRHEHEPFASDTIPARAMVRAVKSAHKGILPTFTTHSVLHRLGLLSDTPDGLGLAERFTDSRSSPLVTASAFAMELRMLRLVQLTNEGKANLAQEAVASTLGVVVTRQYFREGMVCAGVKLLAANSTRDDIIPRAIQLIGQFNVTAETMPGYSESWGGIVQNNGFPPNFEFNPSESI